MTKKDILIAAQTKQLTLLQAELETVTLKLIKAEAQAFAWKAIADRETNLRNNWRDYSAGVSEEINSLKGKMLAIHGLSK
jgi:hypothetical protein